MIARELDLEVPRGRRRRPRRAGRAGRSRQGPLPELGDDRLLGGPLPELLLGADPLGDRSGPAPRPSAPGPRRPSSPGPPPRGAARPPSAASPRPARARAPAAGSRRSWAACRLTCSVFWKRSTKTRDLRPQDRRHDRLGEEVDRPEGIPWKTWASLLWKAVRKMIGVCCERSRSRISAAVSKPSMPGIWTSIRMTAKSSSRMRSSASSPERARTRSRPIAAQDRLQGEQVVRLVVHQQDVDLLLGLHVVSLPVAERPPSRLARLRRVPDRSRSAGRPDPGDPCSIAPHDPPRAAAAQAPGVTDPAWRCSQTRSIDRSCSLLTGLAR